METIAAQTLERPKGGLRPHLVRVAGSPSVVLFLAIFASQAGVLVLSPILADVAREFDVSISTAGQLRIVAAPLAAVVAVVAARGLARFHARSVLMLGALLLAVGAIASAAAPTFAALALAQIPVWAGVAVLVSAGVSAAGSWSSPADRTRVVAHALAGAPAAWIVGMPLIGVAGELSWRLAFLVLPLPAALLAGLALAARPAEEPGARAATPPRLGTLLRRTNVRRWALSELLANSAWTGTLVYSGALLTEVHGTSSVATGFGLALVAVAYLLGNKWSGQLPPPRARRSMLETSVLAALGVALLWAVTPNLVTTLVLFCLTAFVAAARTVSGTVYGFEVSRDHDGAVGAIRAATNQLGYLVGSASGGLAFAIGGFRTLAPLYAALFMLAAAPYLCVSRSCRMQRVVGAPA